MKRLTDDNPYILLGIGLNASPFEISQAYREACQLYGEDSLASYSFFSREERQEILEKLDEAYSTLIDREKRSQYDRSLDENGFDQKKMDFPRDRKMPQTPCGLRPFTDNTPLKIREELRGLASLNTAIQEILTHDALSGKDLKRIREELGISLEVVVEMTKIRPIYLRAIEEDEFEKAPSRMFLKSFLKAYAQSIGLDPDLVASHYLKRIRD